jgi:hypothetical protein
LRGDGSGDGIMSAIDFTMDLKREANLLGDRVDITMARKFLPNKTYRAVRRSGTATSGPQPWPGIEVGG